jgi:hypothetical protein
MLGIAHFNYQTLFFIAEIEHVRCNGNRTAKVCTR